MTRREAVASTSFSQQTDERPHTDDDTHTDDETKIQVQNLFFNCSNFKSPVLLV